MSIKNRRPCNETENKDGFASPAYGSGNRAGVMACDSKSLADSRTAGSDSYGLNVESMTGTDSYQMELQEGEMLAVHFETVRGSMCMEIQAPDGSSLYQGNGKGVTEFTVNISESGTYSIFVEAHHAKGTLRIQTKEGTI